MRLRSQPERRELSMSTKTKRPRKRRRKLPPRAAPGALERLAAEQGVKPVMDPIKELYAPFWPEDETADYIVETIRRWRREGDERSDP
jgi:hypothetical protein